jgi:hypothetical protein
VFEWSSFLHYATDCEGLSRIRLPEARKSGSKTLSSCGTAPLKPKPGLCGPRIIKGRPFGVVCGGLEAPSLLTKGTP